jgi:pseudouridine-5'-phosphate glycosidase
MRIKYHEEILKAKENNLPIVALESTIISHGMPYPKNLETANLLEDIVRENGAVPATIAIIDGVVNIGLSNEDKLRLAKKEEKIIKCSKRDIPIILAKKCHGSTTVAATMFFAKLAGIEVFVTGGIGGVHRGYDKTFDISNDLEEMAQSEVIVVSAGVKSILDIENTLEYLETKGVLVVTYQNRYFPSFFNRDSEFLSPYTVETVEEIKNIWKEKKSLLIKGGLLVANPIKKEDEYDKKLIDNAIKDGLEEIKIKNIKGKEITPFLLDYIQKKTSQNSLVANINLIKNNAVLGSKIAKELKKK